MVRQWMLLVLFCLCYEACKATSSCKMKMAESYLDIAVDMIGKAKNTARGDCEDKHIYNRTRGAKDCSELLQRGYNKSGIYTIWPASRVTAEKSIEVYCDMQTDGGGWTVIQRRGQFLNAVDYFVKDWASYKNGFGDLQKEFWLGNDNIFALTHQNLYSVRFDLRDVENDTRYALYDTFWIDDESHLYTLHIAGYSGDAGDYVTQHHNNQIFATKDKDNPFNCSEAYNGGWWFNRCLYVQLNGLNLRGKQDKKYQGIIWYAWKGFFESLESTEIKIRPKNFKLLLYKMNSPM